MCSQCGGCAVSLEGVQEVRRVCSQFIPDQKVSSELGALEGVQQSGRVCSNPGGCAVNRNLAISLVCSQSVGVQSIGWCAVNRLVCSKSVGVQSESP